MTQKAHWQPLFERLLAELDRRGAVSGAEGQSTLDPAIYREPARFAAERARLFLAEPLCLGHEDQLAAPGSVLALEPCGVPVLLARGRDGALKAFLNVCRHRGARLVADEGTVCQRQALSCPYHGWTYRLDGSLASVPRAEAFPELNKSGLGLRALPLEVRHGLVWGMLDPDLKMPDMAPWLGAIDGDLQAIGLGGYKFYRQHAVRRASNWKLIVDAFLEVYHVTRLHAQTIGPFFADAVSVSDQVGRHQRYLVARENTAEIRALPANEWSPQVHGTLVHYVFPNTILIYHPDYISHLGMFPGAADETLFVHTMLTPRASATPKEEAHWARSFELIDTDVFNREDLVVCEQIQRGLSCGANERLILGRLEGNLQRFHGSLDGALLG